MQFEGAALTILMQNVHKILVRLIYFIVFFIPCILIYILGALLVRTSIYRVRVGQVQTHRVGHLSGFTELYFAEKNYLEKSFSVRYVDFIHIDRYTVANSYLLNKYKEHIDVAIPYGLFYLLVKCSEFDKFGFIINIGENICGDRDVRGLLEHSDPIVRFSKDELRDFEDQLIQRGVPREARVVCVNVRDAEFYRSKPEINEMTSYRNSDVSTLTPSIKFLTEMGFFVFKMGAARGQKVVIESDRFIDYQNIFRDEKLDVYLAFRCEFFISTGTGWDSLAAISFRKPGLFFNFMPVGYFPTWSPSILLATKKHYSNGRLLQLEEIFNLGAAFCFSTSEFRALSIELSDQTPDEILKDVIYFLNKFLGDDEQSDVLREQSVFKALYSGLYFDNVDKDSFYSRLHKSPSHGSIKAGFAPSMQEIMPPSGERN